MSTKTPGLAILPRGVEFVCNDEKPRVHHMPPVDPDVITDRELEYAAQLAEHDLPRTFSDTAENGFDTAVPGAKVRCKTLLGFLGAIQKLFDDDDALVQMSYSAGSDYLVVEATNLQVWSAGGVQAEPHDGDGFVVLVPLQRAIAVLKVIDYRYPSVSVSVSESGICLGRFTLPFKRNPEGFPPRPEIRDYEARIAFPSSALKVIQQRIMPARSLAPDEKGMNGVLLDFYTVPSEKRRVFCIAIATNGHRMHLLRIPKATIEPKNRRGKLRMPQAIMVPHEFFEHLLGVVDREWTAIEVAEGQISARGDDYLVIAKSLLLAHSTTRDARSWRTVDADYPGFWSVRKQDLEDVLVEGVKLGPVIRLGVDALRNKLEVRNGQAAFLKRIDASPHDGPELVEVTVDGDYLLDTVRCLNTGSHPDGSAGGLLRLCFADTVDKQRTSPIVIFDDNKDSKAIIMPRTD